MEHCGTSRTAPSRSGPPWGRFGLLLLGALLAVWGCSDEGPDTATPSSGTTATTNLAAEGPFRPASALASALQCEGTDPGQADYVVGEPRPVERIDCTVGEEDVSVRTYGSQADVGQVLAAIDRFCGIRTVGDRWVLVLNTPEFAARAQQILGGRVITTSGCG